MKTVRTGFQMAGLLFILMLGFVQCTSDVEEEFEIVNSNIFTQRLANIENFMSPEDLMNFYQAPKKNREGYKSQISHSKNARNIFEIILLEENMLNDSIHSQKVILSARVEESKWQILEIKRNWKCREGRGSTSWGIEKCT